MNPSQSQTQTTEDKELTMAEKTKLVKVYIEDGLSEMDAIILAGFTHKEYTRLKAANPKAALVIRRSTIRLEHKLLKVVTESAKHDARMAQWLLEKKYGDKYNQKARSPVPDDNGEGALASAIRDIQQDDASTAFVGITKKLNKAIKSEEDER